MDHIKNPAILAGLPKLEEYYMMIAYTVASRANCLNRAVGAVLVTSDNRSIIATGYNAVPRDEPHCITCRRRDEGFGPGEGLHRSRAEHAERSVFDQASTYGRATKGGILYVTDMPCDDCCKGIINNYISKVVYCGDYPGSGAKLRLENVGIEVVKLDKHKVLGELTEYLNLLNQH